MSQFSLHPGDTIGILGGGQLARMLSTAAARLGLKTHIYAPEENSPAFQVSDAHTIAAYEDEKALERFAERVSVVTYEFENVPAPTAAFLQARVPVHPGSNALHVSQDRLTEKTFLTQEAGTPTAPFAKVDSQQQLEEALAAFQGKGVLKTRRFGYDGKGQLMLRKPEDAKGAFAKLGNQPAILEGLIDFTAELSVITARAVGGQVLSYEAARNLHENHILKSSTVPAGLSKTIREEARRIAESISTSLGYIGVLGVELFLVEGDTGPHLLVNEIAPRVHNSGHWTEDAAFTSQFEQHMRAVAGWPLGSTQRTHDVTMENLLGDEAQSYRKVLATANARLTLYGKAEVRTGRKMGHVNHLHPLGNLE
ncbi:5-(carboxyamino)imidazole ribonucleotide synthase [Polycladidibacter hongkongensis]|uniref:5-(carboxyamino)imidazole ribonucleotide synthase n=1 Tax=Polycladidibacter hongkongensis TaxID=1647556 RepID=UPI000834AC30|nr:5-(carboxyamino)imidazole ribonucleotide synthase [Pseudovibrio hongkongensis]